MTDHEAESREKQQSRSIDVYKPSGAVLESQYFPRKQKVIAITETELDDIAMLNRVENSLQHLGLFLLSGSTWLGIEKFFTTSKPFENNLFFVCICTFILGGIVYLFGYTVGNNRKSKFQRLIENQKN
jgi:RsiW-degrading membrane proteinase PrsW (M82 family)